MFSEREAKKSRELWQRSRVIDFIELFTTNQLNVSSIGLVRYSAYTNSQCFMSHFDSFHTQESYVPSRDLVYCVVSCRVKDFSAVLNIFFPRIYFNGENSSDEGTHPPRECSAESRSNRHRNGIEPWLKKLNQGQQRTWFNELITPPESLPTPA